ncbi:putative ABM domain-containing protein [Seiridium cardinale]|uniref:ABM domain-containing protein n=1 Tax=Seiridium cardinale TaxID=138064 RepID=A0ABR2XAF5_9PEZI
MTTASPPHGVSSVVTAHLKPEDVPTFLTILKPLYDKVAAEPGCLFFEVYESKEEPGVVCWVEDWAESKEWFFEKEATKEYYKESLPKLLALLTKPIDMKWFNRLGPDYYTAKSNE